MLHLTGNFINQNVTMSTCEKHRGNVNFKGKFPGSTKTVKIGVMSNLNFSKTQVITNMILATSN
jgi:hypothetical protein